MIEIENVTKEYYDGTTKANVLKGINLKVCDGEMVAIMGRSGSGKSTLLNIVGGLVPPTTGTVSIDGKMTNYHNSADLLKLRREKVGFIVQDFALLEKKTLFENVILPVRKIESKKNNYRIIRSYLEELGLTEKLNLFPRQLSNGEKQRTAIARALADNKDILLADEPTGALDYDNANMTVDIIRREFAQRGKTVLLVTHDYEIAKKCDHIYRINYGVIEKY